MLTMTVMQNESGAVGQFGTEPAEAEDVLSRLRHLHHTLQECHWRVQVVDHALCAQGDKGHHGLQNQTGNDHSFEIQATKDYSLQNQAKEDCSLQLEIVKDCNPQSNTEKDQDVEEQVRETINSKEQLENYGLPNQPSEDQNCQIGDREESENHLCEDDKYQKPAEEKHYSLDIKTEDQKLSVEAEDSDIQDLSNDTKENLGYTTENSNLVSIAMNDHIPHDYAQKDNCSHSDTKEKKSIHNSFKKYWFDDTYSFETKQNKYFTKQECMDLGMEEEDQLPIDTKDFLSSIMLPPYNSSYTIPSVSDIMAEVRDQQLQITNPNVISSEKLLKQENWQKGHVGEVRYRPDSIQNLKNKNCHEGDIKFYKKLKKEYVSQKQQLKSEEMWDVKYIGPPPVDSAPEVAQKMDIIWEALENLRSHFYALHSSLVDSSNLFRSQEFAESSDESYISTRESEKVTKYDKLHTMHEDHTSETTQFHQSPCEQSLLGKLPVENHPDCACQNQISSHTPPEEPVNSTALSVKSTHRRAYLRSWRDNCLCIVMAVLLLLLFLFLASCLLLMLPVVSVSVRTAGGLPAF